MRESFLVRIDCDPPARIWQGVGDLEIPADAVEDAPAIYLGGGEMLGLPDFQQLINGVAERLEFQVSGVSDEMLRLALEDAATVKGTTMHLGRIDFDESWQQLGPVEWEATFRCDLLRVDSTSTDKARERTITLSVGTQNTERSRAPISFFTDADQRRRSADDDIFISVGGIYAGTSRRFGPAQ